MKLSMLLIGVEKNNVYGVKGEGHKVIVMLFIFRMPICQLSYMHKLQSGVTKTRKNYFILKRRELNRKLV